MADQPVTREKLINADKDVQVIEDFIKKSKDETVTTRFGDEIMTLKGLEKEVKKSGGYFKRYTSLADANADIGNIPVNGVVKVTDAVDGGDYEKAAAGATSLTKSAYDPLTQAKNYADLKTILLKENFILEESDLGIFFLTSDRVPLFHVLNDGSFHLSGDIADLREHVENIPKLTTNDLLYEFKDVEDNIVAYVKNDGGFYIAGNDISLQDQIKKSESTSFLSIKIASITDAQGKTIFASNIARTFPDEDIKNLVTVEPFPKETGKTQRIGAALKLPNNKILFMWGGGIGAPYNGDSTGVVLYKRILTYSENGYVMSKGVKETFRQTSDPAGLAKHPMLGRTKTGRIVLIWDERNSDGTTVTQYKTMVAFSDDEGLSFTSPVEIPANPLFTLQVTGSTGTIVTLSTGRLVCPMYYTTPTACIGMMYSDDGGATWQYGNTLALTVQGSLQEPAITVDETDKIYVSSRSTNIGRRKHLSISTDGGQTLQEIGFNQQLPTPNVASTIYYDFENNLMLHGGATNTNARDKYQIQMSADKAVTFPINYQPFSDNFYIGYSQLIKLSTNKYAVVVEGLTESADVNSAENIGIFIFNLKEAFSHVSYN